MLFIWGVRSVGSVVYLSVHAHTRAHTRTQVESEEAEWVEGTWFGSSEELYSVNTLPWSDTYSAFSWLEQSRDVNITESFGAGAEEGGIS